ncbi:MAG: hypothetical protein QM648_12220 [Solirubrobacterales bacterium]
MVTAFNAHRRVLPGFVLAVVATVVVFGGFANSANAESLLPAPSIVSGPADGSTINTDSTQFAFDYLDPITGGSLLGYVCTIDAGAPVACDSGLDIADLSAGLHTIGVKATLALLGGQPLCVLTICVDPGPVSVDTDLLTRTFNVDLGGGSVGTGGSSGTNGSNGSVGANGSSAASDRTAAFLLAWMKYKNQRALCTRMKSRIHHYKTHRNRMSAARRHKTCVKRQNKLRAAAIAIR